MLNLEFSLYCHDLLSFAHVYPVISLLKYHINQLLYRCQIVFLPLFLSFLYIVVYSMSLMSPLHAARKELWAGIKEDFSTHFCLLVSMFTHSKIFQRYLLNSYQVQDCERKVGDKTSNKKDMVLPSLSLHSIRREMKKKKRKRQLSMNFSQVSY